MPRSVKGRHEIRQASVHHPVTPVRDAARRWKALTRAANAAFAQARWSDAEPLYDDALAEAQRLFEGAQAGAAFDDAEPAPMLVAATANAVENWLRLEKRVLAGDALIALNHRLCAVVDDEHCRPSFRQQCFWHLKTASLEIMTGLRKAGCSEDDVTREVMHARTIALRFIERTSPKH